MQKVTKCLSWLIISNLFSREHQDTFFVTSSKKSIEFFFRPIILGKKGYINCKTNRNALSKYEVICSIFKYKKGAVKFKIIDCTENSTVIDSSYHTPL